MPFPKGISGNPGGRPKELAEVQAAARSHTVAAITTLSEICADESAPPAARVAAANALLDRGWGRPLQAIDASVTVTTLADLVAASMLAGTIDGASERVENGVPRALTADEMHGG
jgi:hypothetical protein